MKLKYVGPNPQEHGGVPLPEGWPAFDHTEPDKDIAKEKIAGGMYEADKEPQKPAKADAESEK